MLRGRAAPDPAADPANRGDYWGVVLGAADPQVLGRFYAEVLGWSITKDGPNWVTLYPGEGVAYLAIQREEDYVAPVWPEVPGQQQMMSHLDIEVHDLQAAVEHAVELGAVIADFQPQDNVRVMLDPAGHPFCLYS